MSAPPPEHPASLTSSGFEDGLGRRSLVFDRSAGVTIERLTVRPELGAFERALTDRTARLAAFEDERIARVRGVQRDPANGALTVDADFVPGSRLSDLIDVLAEGSEDTAAAGLDVALGFLLEILPALGALHTTGRMSHGAVGPGRTVLTAEGRVVLVDALFGEALQRLQFTPERLWTEFGLAMPAAIGPPRLDATADLAQAGLSALTLALGRPLGREEYPDGLPSALSEVLEIAQIRASAVFAARLERFLRQILPLPDRRPFSAAKDALKDLQDFADAELGVANCRAVLGTFIREAASAAHAQPTPTAHVAWVDEPEIEAAPEPMPEPLRVVAEPEVVASLPEPEPIFEARVEPEYEVPFETTFSPASIPEAETAPEIEAAEATPVHEHAGAAFATEPEEAPAVAIEDADTTAQSGGYADAGAVADIDPAPIDTIAPDHYETAPESVAAEADAPEPVAAEDSAGEVDEADAEPASAVTPPSSARRKRNRGPRAKRDKLRSNAAPPAPLATPAPVVAPPPPKPAAPIHVEAPPPPRPVVPIRMPFAPPPQEVAEPGSAYTSERFWQAPAAAPIPVAAPRTTPSIAVVPGSPPHAPAGPAPLRVKAQPPAGYAPPAPPRSTARTPDYSEPAVPYVPRNGRSGRSSVPWKLAAAAVVIIIGGFAASRGYLSTSGPATVTAAPKPASATTAPVPPKVARDAPGTIEIASTPSGAKVLLDGADAGETPLTLSNVVPGRRVVTLVSSEGTVRRTVRVQPGKTVSLDIPVYSGFVNIISPIALEVAVGGRAVGTTDQGRMLLPPGRHELTLSNGEYDYVATHMVEIESGEELRTKVEPRATVSIQAVPWAEVWIDGKLAGETPMANMSIVLGTHEVVFKHPQFGERRMTATIKASSPTTLTVDFTR